MNQYKWLEWANKLQAISQNGLAYATNPFETQRCLEIQQIAAEIIAGHTHHAYQDILDLFGSEAGYATPKLDVRGVVFQDDAILLVREVADGGWTLPGGWVDIDESPREAVEKEVREESGYIVRATRLLAVYDRNKHPHPPYIHHIIKLFILCELIGGAPAESIETSGAVFFPQHAIPPLSIPRVTHDQIARMFEFHRSPTLPTDFD
ncbi:MAG: NUDIX hydrolase [Anaerolineae bacterium]|nr:NUDIX hydrolase [Anaerolineae bacterium]